MTDLTSETQLPIILLDVELSRPLPAIPLPPGDAHRSALALVRLHGIPIGQLQVDDLAAPGLSAVELARLIDAELRPAISEHLTQHGVANPDPLSERGLDDRADHDCGWRRRLPPTTELPLVTVVVAAIKADSLLDRVLEGLSAQTYPNLETIVVDNRPETSGITQAISSRIGVRYLAEAARGSSAARNAGWRAGRGDIIAFTDDDVVLDPEWCAALVSGFSEPEVGCVTGLILPDQLQTAAQVRLEQFGGFSKGFSPTLFSLADPPAGDRLFPYTVGRFGSGANCAVRREALEQCAGFTVELGAGTMARGGEDLDLFLNVLRANWTIRYEPAALVRHRHRDRNRDLRRQILNYGIGLSALITRRAATSRLERLEIGRRLATGVGYAVNPTSKKNEHKGPKYPLHLTMLELIGMVYGPVAYFRGRTSTPKPQKSFAPADNNAVLPPHDAVQIALLDLEHGVSDIAVDAHYRSSRLTVRLHGQPVGFVDVPLDASGQASAAVVTAAIEAAAGDKIRRHLASDGLPFTAEDYAHGLPASPDCLDGSGEPITLSVVVCTRDRADILRDCLDSLAALEGPVAEFIIVDNAPRTDETRQLVAQRSADDPRFRYVLQPRPGLSNARNAGLREASSTWVAFTDDDVQLDSLWLRGLARGIRRRADVGIVTGLVATGELETASQAYFDRRVSWASNTEPAEWTKERSPADSPLHPLTSGVCGAGACFAVDRDLAVRLGGFDADLGAGAPTGGGEDLDIFLRTMFADRAVVFEPSALVWHTHRRTEAELRSQIRAYGKGLAAYGTKWVLDRRGRRILLTQLPQVVKRLLSSSGSDQGGTSLPLSFVRVEWAGLASGPFIYLRTRSARRKAEKGATKS